MSDSGPDEVLVSVEGVTVEKSVDTEQFETLAVMFDFHVEQTETVRVQLTDMVPEEIPIDDVGFHPDYGAEYWTIDDGRVVFEREFDQGEEYTTIYGVRDVAAEDVELFLAEPDLEVIEGEQAAEPAPTAEVGPSAGGERPGGGDELEELEDIVSRENSDVIRDVIAGDADAMPGVESDEADEPVEAAGSVESDEPASPEPAGAPEPAVEPESAADPAAGDAPDADVLGEAADVEEAEAVDGATTESEPPEEPRAAEEPTPAAEDAAAVEAAEVSDGEEEGEITVPVTGGVARVLAKELREGTLREEDQAVLREELVETDDSTDARIQHLQHKVSDLEAYTEALEAFINEEGPAQELIDDVTADMNEIREEMQGLRADVRGIGDEMEELRGDVESMQSETEASFNDIEAEMDGIAEMVSELESGLASVEDELDGLDSEVSSVGNDVERVDNRASELEDDVSRLEADRQEAVADIDAVEAAVESLETELESLRADRDRLSDLESEVDAVQDDLAEMASFRERLMNALGQGMGGGESTDDG